MLKEQSNLIQTATKRGVFAVVGLLHVCVSDMRGNHAGGPIEKQ